MSETFQYTVSTDAFTVGQYYFPAATETFIFTPGQLSVPLTGSFDGWALGSVDNHYDGLYFTLNGADKSFFGTPGEFAGLQTTFVTAPTVSNVPVMTSAPNFVVGVRMTPDTYEWQFVQGTVTATGFNLPEPDGFALMFLGLVVFAAFIWRTK